MSDLLAVPSAMEHGAAVGRPEDVLSGRRVRRKGVPGPPAPAAPRLSVGITGHRFNNASLADNSAAVAEALGGILDLLAGLSRQLQPDSLTPRLVSLLAEGADQLAAVEASKRSWPVLAPLPFGLALTAVMGAGISDLETVKAVLAPETGQSLEGIGKLDSHAAVAMGRFWRIASGADVFELAERDEQITRLLVESLANPQDSVRRDLLVAEASGRYAAASRIMIEQSDIVIAIWDGLNRSLYGGTGHTIAAALELGVPVVWLPPAAPDHWRILMRPEDLVGAQRCDRREQAGPALLIPLVSAALCADPGSEPVEHKGAHSGKDQDGLDAYLRERWPRHSNPIWHAYRRVEALFGEQRWSGRLRPLRRIYAKPEGIADAAWRPVLQAAEGLSGPDPRFRQTLIEAVAERFAWADAISTQLSDSYRGAMVTNFGLSASAIVAGLAYLPFATKADKWMFALGELLLLVAILLITALGRARSWHSRWFQTRRVAEYLRHSPLLLLLGVARPIGRWPRGLDSGWPEWYARHALRSVGLPRAKITQSHLIGVLNEVLTPHIRSQREYHRSKAAKLSAVHRNLDSLSNALFVSAVLVVAAYVVWKLAPHPSWLVSPDSNLFTFLGVVLPMLGATLAGIRYFGDFERFAAISEVTAEALQGVEDRIHTLAAQCEGDDLTYDEVARLAHAADDIVFSEIENWQAVFGGKHLTVPA